VRVHRTSDLGASWTELSPLLASDAQGLASSDGVVYAATAEGRAYRSTDAGGAWTEMTSISGFVFESPHALAAQGGDVMATRGFYGVAASHDHGLTWSPMFIPALSGELVWHVFATRGLLFAAAMRWEGGPSIPPEGAPTYLYGAGLFR